MLYSQILIYFGKFRTLRSAVTHFLALFSREFQKLFGKTRKSIIENTTDLRDICIFRG
jgi:hypothetical protein